MGHQLGLYFKSSVRYILVVITLFALSVPQASVFAAPSLTVTPITWNIIGLDSNNVNVGPNDFPVGARVCNTGDAATNVTANFVWDDTVVGYKGPTPNSHVNLRTGSLSTITIPALAAGSVASPTCYDFYFEVIIDRNTAAYSSYDKTTGVSTNIRRYHIEISADTIPTFSTPSPRDIFVEHLISQNRNGVDNVELSTDGGTTYTSYGAGATMNLMVGSTYHIRMDGHTATQGYNQLEDFINLPNTIFQVLSVASTYSADTSTFVANSSDKLYADACLWDTDPTSLTYRSCIGSDGKIGGTISTDYTVKIIGGAGTTQALSTLIYDFSGSSFHYNSDLSTSIRYASISSPLTMSKSFSPTSITTSQTSTLTITINNTGSSVTGVSLTDPMPSGVTISGSATSSCGGISNTASSITLTNATIPTAGCAIQATVVGSSNGTYTNTTGDLFINGSDTGTNASANLTVASTSTGSNICGTLAEWKMTPGVSSENTNPPGPTQSIGTAVASYANVATSIDTGTGNPVNSWKGSGWQKSDTVVEATSPYFQFQVPTNSYNSVTLTFDATILTTNPTGPSKVQIYKSNDNSAGSYTLVTTATPIGSTFGTFGPYTVSFNASGATYYRFYGTSAQNQGAGDLYIDNINFFGCGPAAKPTITKAFSPVTIGAGGTSTLTFTLSNTNSVQLTSAAFSDTFPSGMTYSSTTSNSCGGTLTASPNTAISLAGGTIPPNSSCTVEIVVTAASAGVYNNTSGYISTSESGTNTGADGFASATLTVLSPPQISKSFSPNPIYSGGTSTLTFTITNPNASPPGLSGVGFTDVFPTGLTVSAAPSSSQCGGNVTYTSGSITLANGSLAAGGSCTVTVLTTASTVGSYENGTSPNPTVTVSAIISGVTYNGNTASDTLGVQTTHPGISILKQVSTSLSGPWGSTVNVASGQSVYYQFTIENIGDVPLSPVSITDSTLDASSCVWPSTLPVGTASVDPTATCVVGPVTAQTGSHSNTATAHGTYSGTVYDSTPSTATYATTALTLVKNLTSVTGTGSTSTSFGQAGNVITYGYRITNNGAAALSPLPAVVTDSNTSVSCPSTDTSGNHDSSLDPGEYVDCTATYTVTAFDVSVGSVTNTAYATVSGVNSNRTSKIVYMNLPDLVVSKTNDTSGYAYNQTPFTWTLTVSNNGPLDATFSNGQTILSDQLPTTGASYGTLPATLSIVSSTGITGTINCSIDASALVTCTASGGSVTIGGTTGSFSINISVTPNATGSLTNPKAIVNPPTSLSPLTYAVTESNYGNNQAADSVTVNNPLPVATNDSGTTPVSTALNSASTGTGQSVNNASILTNDTGISITLNNVTGTGAACTSFPCTINTTHGSVVVASSGTYTYTPTAGYSGTDSFTYQIKDNANQTANATVNLTITPAAVNDTGTTPANTALDSTSTGTGQSVNNASILTNDTGTSIVLNSVTGSGAACTSFPCTITTTHGSAVVAASGSYTYTPTTGYSGPDSFTYQIKDAANQTANATVNLTITPAAVNDTGTTPANTALDSTSTGTGQSVNNASILTNDTGTSATLNSVTGTGAACTSFPCTITTTHGSVVVASSGSYTYTPTTGYSGPDNFTYQIKDAANQTANATVNLTVTPTATDDGAYSVPFNTASTGGGVSILTNDTGTSLTVASVTGSGAACTSFPCTISTTHGSVTVQTDGTFSYTPTTGYSGSDSFTYYAKDSSGQNTNIAIVSFSVQLPGAPVATDDTGTTPANTALDSTSTGTGQSVNNASILTNDTGTSITLNSVTGTGAACTSFPCTITTTHGSAVVAASGSYTYTPTTGYSGPDSFTYQIKDSANQTSNAAVNLTVTPVAANDGAYSVPYNTASTGGGANILSNDTGTSLTVASVTGSGAACTSFPCTISTTHGSVTVQTDGTFSYTPTTGYVGSDSFTYYAKDSSSQNTNTATVSFTVAPPPAPTATDDTGTTVVNTAIDSTSTGTGQSVNNASILTNDTGTSITLNSVTGTGAACTSFPCTINTTHGSAVAASSGTYTYTPTTGYSGPDSFTYQIKDAANQTANATVNLTVTPTATDDGAYSVPYNTASTGGGANILSNDTGTGLTVASVTGSGAACTSFPCTISTTHGSVAVASSGTYTYTPTTGYVGLDSFTYYAKDSSNQNTNTATVSFTVAPPPAPTATDDSGTTPANTALDSTSTGTGQSVNNASILTNDTGTSITLNSVTGTGAACTSFPCTINTTHGSAVVASSGSYAYTPTTGYSGPDSFTYQIKDAANQTANATVNLTVTPISTLTGTVFNDANTNGTQDSGENGIGTVTIELQNGICTPDVNCPTTLTASNGTYSFTGLAGGSYTVVEKDPSGYISSTSNTVSVTVPVNGSAQANFGDYRISGTSTNSINGTVFEDTNANGILDNGEQIIPSVTVTLYDQNNQVVATTATAANGTYAFSNLPAGIYIVVETNPGGYISTTLDHVGVALSSGTNAVINYGDQKSNATIIDPAVTKYGDPSNAQVGDTVVYTITVGNNGNNGNNVNADALNVVLTDTKPAFLDIISINVSPNKNFPITISGNTFTINFGTVTPTDFYTVTVLTRVNNLGQAPGGDNNVSVATSSLNDPVFNDNAVANLVIAGASTGGGSDGGNFTSLPKTGFAPNTVTALPLQPADKTYAAQDGVWLEIPRLGVQMPIVGVLQSNGSWDITWLGDQAGWLQGTAFPSWSGNSVLTGHVYLSNGQPGPFVGVSRLQWGDQIIIHAFGQRYIYEVRTNTQVLPNDVSVISHKTTPWLTLLTCKDFDAASNSYLHRVAVSAALVRTEPESSKQDSNHR